MNHIIIKIKKSLEPNKSFDLCRLACSLFDYFFENAIPSEEELEDPIAQLILKWTRDDKGRNILYKKNGEERYPEFKLYKMIVRTVHNHTPENEIKNLMFDDYIISSKKQRKSKYLIWIQCRHIYNIIIVINIILFNLIIHWKL